MQCHRKLLLIKRTSSSESTKPRYESGSESSQSNPPGSNKQIAGRATPIAVSFRSHQTLWAPATRHLQLQAGLFAPAFRLVSIQLPLCGRACPPWQVDVAADPTLGRSLIFHFRLQHRRVPFPSLSRRNSVLDTRHDTPDSLAPPCQSYVSLTTQRWRYNQTPPPPHRPTLPRACASSSRLSTCNSAR